jgi:hypothetical protein
MGTQSSEAYEDFNRMGRKEFLFYEKCKEHKALRTLRNRDKEI